MPEPSKDDLTYLRERNTYLNELLRIIHMNRVLTSILVRQGMIERDGRPILSRGKEYESYRHQEGEVWE